MSLGLLILCLPALADTGEVSCRDWAVIPDNVVTFTDTEHLFRIDAPRSCQVGLECYWSLTQPLGSLDHDEGFSVTWTTPHDPPPSCDPLDASLVATCTLWGNETRTSTASLMVGCTDDQREELEEERAAHSPQGGGCGSAGPAEALLLLPFGLWGLRRRLRSSCQPSAVSKTTFVDADS